MCAFAIALVLTRGIKGTNIFRTVFFMPNLIGGILLGYIWQILLNGVLANLQKPLLALDAKAGFVGLDVYKRQPFRVSSMTGRMSGPRPRSMCSRSCGRQALPPTPTRGS